MTEAAGEALQDAYLDPERHLPRPLAEHERALDEVNEALEQALETLVSRDVARARQAS